MNISDRDMKNYGRRIQLSRMRLLCNNGFYGLLLMHMRMVLSDKHETAWSDMKDKIYFNPAFLAKISDRELDYCLMHVILHVVLEHVSRRDSVSGRSASSGRSVSSGRSASSGGSAPAGQGELFDQASDIVVNSCIFKALGEADQAISLEVYGGVQPHMAPDGREGSEHTVEEIYQMLLRECPSVVDDANNEELPGNAGGFDNEESHDNDGNGTSGNGWDYHGGGSDGDSASGESEDGDSGNGNSENGNLISDLWKARVLSACETMQSKQGFKASGNIPGFVERYVDELKKPKIDWRTVLDEFVQEEINDYSWAPPDSRYQDMDFYLPSFSEKDFKVERILFMIDTSGSMSNEEISECYSEIKGAIDQFNGKLEGWLGFFDARVVEPKPFVDEDEFKAIRPMGGGGTSFGIIFDYVREYMADDLPRSIVILTDGFAPWPRENASMGIPVLWIINNDEAEPPWGKVARILNGEASKM